MCLRAKTEEVSSSTFWALSHILVSGLTQNPCRSSTTLQPPSDRLGTRYESVRWRPCAARGDWARAVRTRGSSMQVDAGPDLERPKRTYGKHVLYLGPASRPLWTGPGDTVHPPWACPKRRVSGAYRLTVCVCRAYCSKLQATSTDLFLNFGGDSRIILGGDGRKGGSDMIDCLRWAHRAALSLELL